MKRKSKEMQKLDAQLAYWAETDKQHKAEVARLEALHKNDLDWFDHVAYQRMIYEGGWSK